MTRRERLERKLEKRREWAESRDRKAAEAFQRADLREEKSGIPFGQPILVGHHSERRHRRAIERADSAMRRGVESADMATHHRSKAAGLENQLVGTIFSDDPDAVEALEAKIAGLEAERERNKQANRIIRKKPKNESTPEKIAALTALLGSEAEAVALFTPDFCGRVGIPSYRSQNLSGNIKRCRDRLKSVKRQQDRAKRAEESGGLVIDRAEGANWCQVTFEEKPEREILKALKAAGYHWGGGCWTGRKSRLPAEVAELEAAQS